MDKTRNLSIYELYEQLQLEYLSCKLRRKIYPIEKDRVYWGKVMSFKEAKIRNISERNLIPSLFTDQHMYNHFERKVINEFGPPSFTYKNEEDRLRQEKLDLIFYYQIGSKVRISSSSEILIGTVKIYDYETGIVSIELESKEIEDFNISLVSRIF